MPPNKDNIRTHASPHKLFSFFLALLLMISTFLLIRVPDSVKGYIYGIFREIARGQVLLRTYGWHQIEDDIFIIRHQGDENGANMVRETTHLFYGRICADFNYSPERKIPIVVYSSREELNASFGWPASENAMGVYWGGVIRVLAPEVWIKENDPQAVRGIFQQAGPMAHEMTHLVLDYIAKGNYPRWFTEGLAQYEEFKITGFMFTYQEGIWNQGLYPLSKMDRHFDSLPDQALAYRQSLSAVEFIIAVYGEEGLHSIINNLAQGINFDDSMEKAIGVTQVQFEKEWHDWLSKELYQPVFLTREDEAEQWTN